MAPGNGRCRDVAIPESWLLRLADIQGVQYEPISRYRRAGGAVLACGLPAAALADAVIGSAAPAFRLQDQNENWVSLAEQKGKWVVLYFYPMDDTPGCTTEACEFRDNIFAFRSLGVTVLGVSVQDVEFEEGLRRQARLAVPTARRYRQGGREGLRRAERDGLRAARDFRHRPAGTDSTALPVGRSEDALEAAAD